MAFYRCDRGLGFDISDSTAEYNDLIVTENTDMLNNHYVYSRLFENNFYYKNYCRNIGRTETSSYEKTGQLFTISSENHSIDQFPIFTYDRSISSLYLAKDYTIPKIDNSDSYKIKKDINIYNISGNRSFVEYNKLKMYNIDTYLKYAVKIGDYIYAIYNNSGVFGDGDEWLEKTLNSILTIIKMDKNYNIICESTVPASIYFSYEELYKKMNDLFASKQDTSKWADWYSVNSYTINNELSEKIIANGNKLLITSSGYIIINRVYNQLYDNKVYLSCAALIETDESLEHFEVKHITDSSQSNTYGGIYYIISVSNNRFVAFVPRYNDNDSNYNYTDIICFDNEYNLICKFDYYIYNISNYPPTLILLYDKLYLKYNLSYGFNLNIGYLNLTDYSYSTDTIDLSILNLYSRCMCSNPKVYSPIDISNTYAYRYKNKLVIKAGLSSISNYLIKTYYKTFSNTYSDYDNYTTNNTSTMKLNISKDNYNNIVLYIFIDIEKINSGNNLDAISYYYSPTAIEPYRSDLYLIKFSPKLFAMTLPYESHIVQTYTSHNMSYGSSILMPINNPYESIIDAYSDIIVTPTQIIRIFSPIYLLNDYDTNYDGYSIDNTNESYTDYYFN